MFPRWLRPILSICLVSLLISTHGPVLASPNPSLVINELLARNRSNLVDESGNTSDWIELLNPHPFPVALDGYALSDSPQQPRRWVFRSGSIPPGGFLVVFADGKDRQLTDASPIAPTSLPGLTHWFNSTQVNSADTNQVRRSGSSWFVKKWINQTGSGRDLLQNAGGLQPVWIAASNGLPSYLRFDGANDVLQLPQIPATNDFCIVVVVRNRSAHEIDGASASGTGGTSGQRYLLGATHMGALDGGMGVSMGMNGVSCYEHGDGYMPALASVSAPLTNQFQVLAFQYSNKVSRIAWQGNPIAEGIPSSRRQVTAPTTVGSGPYGSWNGDLAEILIYDRALSETELRGVQRHLMAQYQLPARDALHANFSLDASGETILLSAPDGTLLDSTTIPSGLPSDVAFGRHPDAVGAWAYFAQPTPGSSNMTSPAFRVLPAPSFSHPPGFHTQSFPLSLLTTAPECDIHFTLDGSEPTPRSPRYNLPLTITNRSRVANNLSLIPTVPGGIPPPSGSVYKFAVVRARCFASNAIPGPIITGSFIVDPLGPKRYSLPVVSLTTARANLFDDAIGIYVPGNAPGGNYAQSGDAWERPGWVEFFEPNGSLGFSQGTGIRMHGNTSFLFPIKGLRLHPLNEPGTGPFQHRIFPDRPTSSFNRLLLRPSGHDYNLTLFRDVFMQSLGAELGLETQASRPAILFINGEYWGIHHCQEAFEPGYFAERSLEAREFGTDYLEGYAAPVEGDSSQWMEMIQFIQTHPLSNPSHYQALQRWMHPAHYADYKIAETFYYRWDIGNHRLWRPRTPEGRFRWILFDCDVGWGGFWSVPPAWSFRMLDYNLESNGPWTQYQSQPGGHDHNSPTTTFLLRSLMENPEFKRMFISRFADVMNSTFQSNHVLARIDRFAGTLAPEIAEHVRRWQAPATTTEWSNQVRTLRQFALQRPGFMYQQIASRFGLPGTLQVTVSVQNTNSGSVQLNSIEVRAPREKPWTGVYFQNHPITARAQPEDGHRFVRWLELDTSDNPVTLTSSQPFSLTALFEPDPNQPPPDPPPHVLSQSPFVLKEWPSHQAAGTFPTSTQLLLSTHPDPALVPGVEFDRPWTSPYNLSSKSRALGLDTQGLGFLNTSDPQSPAQGYLGALVVALDTRGLRQIQVRFTAATLQANSRQYGLRLQARLGQNEPFSNITDPQGNPVDYVSAQAPDEKVIGPFTLPSQFLNQSYVQLRWVYHHLSGHSGARALLRLDDVVVSENIANPPPHFTGLFQHSPGLFTLEGAAPPFTPCQLESSTDLRQWTPLITTMSDADGRWRVEHQLLPNAPRVFLRFRTP